MNSVSENTAEAKPADDMVFLERFAYEQQTESSGLSEEEGNSAKCFDENGDVIFEKVTENDILHNNYLYDQVLTLADEIDVQNYISDLRQVAKKFRLATDFDKKVKPYKTSALKEIKRAEKQKLIDEHNKRAESFPEWWDGETIDEDKFCECLLKKRTLKCIHGLFFDIDGVIEESRIENQIYDLIKAFCKKSIGDRVKAIVRTLKVKCYSEPFIDDINTIHLRNGTLKTDGSFTTEKCFCRNRLEVNMPAEYKEPEKWLAFLNDLLEPDDILTLQEFMGYCFVPCNKGQVMLFIIGSGGEGKSRIGLVMQSLLGSKSYSSLKLKALTGDKFSAESLVNKLLCVDDDISGDKLSDTSKLKEIITAEGKVHINPKGRPPFETELYSRLMAFGNNCLSALYDHSDGFYRRQIIINTKPAPKNRIKDSLLIDKLLTEKEQIFYWAFKGLQRLVENKYSFTVSEKAKQNLAENKRSGCNIISFLELKDSPYIAFEPESEITTASLYSYYQRWCADNAESSLANTSFSKYIKANAEKYGIEYKENIYFTDTNGNKKHVRGFKGIKDLHPYVKFRELTGF